MLPRVDLIRAQENDWLLLNSEDHLSDFIRKNGFWGHTESVICEIFINGRKGVSVIDAGANIGGFAVPTAKKLDKNNGALIAFEPQRIAFQQLCANIFLNRLDNVYAYNVALGDSDTTIEIPELDYSKSRNVGGFSIDKSIRKHLAAEAALGRTFSNAESEHLQSYSVQQRKLDTFDIASDIGLLKVDVEGYELEFFDGAAKTLKRNKFPPIIFELWEGKDWYKDKADKTEKKLHDWGYRFEKFGREILAQHPDHPIQCKVDRSGEKTKLSLV